MALTVGSRLGPYEVVAPLGAGGMGEVYRARDSRLDRTVAIKVLTAELAGDQDFQQRFQNEARAISQLTHPHICTLHDIGNHEGTTFLVMELLVGETLADRLARGTPEHPALTVDVALQIGIQIADALATAHQQGIVHRDLKPGNVMLTRAGKGQTGVPHAKLLDFGLAKAAQAAVASDLATSPTTPKGITAQGVILGTVEYMAPEQIEGGAIDARTDIFALGGLLYEMLTGRKAFEGKSHASLMAAILERDPLPVSALEPRTPALAGAAVARCLAKDPDARWQSAADLATALRWALDGSLADTAARPVPNTPSSLARMARPAAAAALAAATFVMGLALDWPPAGASPARVTKFTIQPPEGTTWSPSPISSAAQLALSPDGQQLAFVAATKRRPSQIWVRPLNAVTARPLAGTEGALFPFWSPDSRFIGFFADGKIKKIDITGGVAQTLGDAPGPRGGSWSPSGDIVFTPSPNSGILRISAEGGGVSPVTIIPPDQAVTAHYWPQFLLDGRHLMYYQRSSKREHQGVYVADLESRTTKQVVASDGRAVHVPGYLLMVRDGMLFALPFDDRQFVITGDPVRVADSVGYFTGTFGDAAVSASATGALAFGPDAGLTSTLQWRDRGGAVVSTPLPPSAYQSPRVSPDQKSALLSIIDRQHSSSPDVWTLDLTRGTLSRQTSDPRSDWFPVWAPDGSRIFFSSTRAGTSSLFKKSGNSPEEAVTESARLATYATDITSDGGLLIYQQITQNGYDLGLLSTSGDRNTTFLATRFNEVQGRIAPNQRWLAYASDEAGRFDVYVRPFPTGSGQWTISTAGGMQPVWRGDGKELFYVTADGRLMAVAVATDGSTFSAGTPRALFEVDFAEATAPFPTDYDVTTNGQRFLMNMVVDQPVRPPLTVTLNWAAEIVRH